MAKFCNVCGNEIENDVCSNCERAKKTKNYLNIATITFIVGCIGAFVCGDQYRIDDEFNYGLTLSLIVSVFFLCTFIVAIHSICYRLDLLININNKSNK